MTVSAPLLIDGLRTVAPLYKGILCDVWGVLHNGVSAFEDAHRALTSYREAGGKVVLITNAPRPAKQVAEVLAKLGVAASAYDDIITSASYRIGPGEIEDCLIRHPAVALAAAVGKPDPLRTEIVKAFVVLKSDELDDENLASDIRDFVREHLSAHEYPREIEFVSSLPMTTTGKVIRRKLRELARSEAC